MPSKLPPELAPALRARRRELAAKATGRILDLGGWNDHTGCYPDSGEVTRLDSVGDLEASVGEFDTIVSMVRTPLVADLNRFISELIARLAPGGHILFLEPTMRTGRVGQLLALGGRLSRSAIGLHLDRDVPDVIRRNGLFVTDLHRFEVPSVSAPLRPFVEAHCRRPTPEFTEPDAEIS